MHHTILIGVLKDIGRGAARLAQGEEQNRTYQDEGCFPIHPRLQRHRVYKKMITMLHGLNYNAIKTVLSTKNSRKTCSVFISISYAGVPALLADLA